MGIEHPGQPVIQAIQSAVAWLDAVKLNGISVVDKPDAALARGFDGLVQNPKGEPLWARFYEIGTNRPIFCGRDGVIKSSLAEIEYERRTGYRWYVTTPAASGPRLSSVGEEISGQWALSGGQKAESRRQKAEGDRRRRQKGRQKPLRTWLLNAGPADL
jgi:hypothetical protein